MTYYEKAAEKLELLRQKEKYYILAIESSCDETAAAVLEGKKVLSNIIATQIPLHRRFGGVVPEIASRNHLASVDGTVKEALDAANLTFKDIDLIAVTTGAGLLGALLVGVSYAKSLAYALEIPLISVDHIKGHISANFIENDSLSFPFICLLASGGHTAILRVNSYFDVKILGSTVDDAAGEAFDKVARVLSLPYPGGPEIQKAAKSGKAVIPLPRAFKNETHLNFSYSGLKTAVINYVHNAKARGEEINTADVAASFQKEAVGVLIDHAIEGAKREGINTIALAGGVGANSALREGLKKACLENGMTVHIPERRLCTDNAAMIGLAAYLAVKEGAENSPLTLDANPARSV